MAKKWIELPTIGDTLREEFLEPYNLSAYKVAKDINVPVSRIQEILKNRRAITIDTSIRLGRYFGLSENYFLSLQQHLDIMKFTRDLPEDIKAIKPLNPRD